MKGAILVACLALTGCLHLVVERVPMPVQRIPAPCAEADTLLVIFPGAFDRPADFVAEGFVEALTQRGIAAEVALVDASLPYYRARSIVERIEADVLAPARARGIRHLWFAGISLGGLGSLILANVKPAGVDGVLLIAPYVGETPVIAEVAAAGGLGRWTPPAPLAERDDDRHIWQWLKRMTNDRRPWLSLGYGTEDRNAAGHRLLADALPPDRVFTAPGGHDWPPWRAVWASMLDAAPLPRGCAR